MIKRISTIAGCILAVSAVVGMVWRYDASIVKAEDIRPLQQAVDKLNKRIDKSDMKSLRRDMQRRKWMLEDKYGYDPAGMPPAVRNEYRCLERDMRDIDEELKAMSGD